MIKSVYGDLERHRKSQVVFARMVRGAFFKYYDAEGVRPKVKRPLCEGPNSRRRLQPHFPIAQPGPEAEDDLAQYLRALTQFLAPHSTVIPIPLHDNEE